jgi:hypothetical protein
MIHIQENWRTFLNEAELKHSEAAANAIYKIAVNAKNSDKEHKEIIKIPSSEIYYLDNNLIKTGAILVYYGNIKNEDFKKIAKPIINYWDAETNAFKSDWVDNILKNYSFPLLVEIGKFDFLGRAATAMITGKPDHLIVQLNPWSPMLKNDDQLKDTIRHELQHITQKVNGLSLSYGKQIVKNKGDITNIEPLDLKDQKSFGEFGVGKEKTGLRQGATSDKDAQAAAPEPGEPVDRSSEDWTWRVWREKKYLGDDFEYETWLSDILSDYVRWIFNNENLKDPLKKNHLVFAGFKEAYSNILMETKDVSEGVLDFLKRKRKKKSKEKSSKEPAGMSDRKKIIGFAKEMNMNPRKYINFYKKKLSYNQLAVKYTKMLISNDAIIKQFDEKAAPEGIEYSKAIKILLELRPKEFPADFVKNLEIRLRKIK